MTRPIASVPPPIYPADDGSGCHSLLVRKRGHAAWLAYHLALNFVSFEVRPFSNAWEFAVTPQGKDALRKCASAYFHDGKELGVE